jgi:hypothetical protein
MQYDFKKVRQVMDERGLTLAAMSNLTEEKTGERIHYSTIGKALETNRAHQRTARALSKALRIPLKELLPEKADAA